MTVPVWQPSALGRALHALGRATGLEVGDPPAVPDVPDLTRWLEATADAMGVEAEPVYTHYPDLGALIASAGPALLRIPASEDQPAGWAVLLRGSRRRATLLGPDGARIRLPVEEVSAAFAAPLEARAEPLVGPMLEAAAVSGRRQARARRALRRELLGAALIGGCWLIRQPPGTGGWAQAREAGLVRDGLLQIGGQIASSLLSLGGWALIGVAALSGRSDPGWLTAWALCLAALVPLQMGVSWVSGMFSVTAAGLVKRRLLQGTLRSELDRASTEGPGRALSMVNEAEALESTAIGGALAGALGVVNLVPALGVLALGAAPLLHVALLVAMVGALAVLGWRYLARVDAWTGSRLALTEGLVERMVGHRTRLAQERPDRLHVDEDTTLARTHRAADRADRLRVHLQITAPRIWTILGIACLIPVFVSGAEPTPLALSLGGVLLVQSVLAGLGGAVLALVRAGVAWRRMRPVMEAAQTQPVHGDPGAAELAPRDGPVLQARQVAFRYRPDLPEVLRDCNLEVQPGDRILLEGPSGGGKSTLASVICGLRRPDRGLLFVGGLDLDTLGEHGWRRRVAAAPQFHENRIFANTLAFNLLMARRWPAPPADLAEAEALCHELGLGPLLERMPAGLHQQVGEMGWRLSHGERSRIFLARALLQGAELIVLDESFGALDPVNLERAMACVQARAGTLMVIAHP